MSMPRGSGARSRRSSRRLSGAVAEGVSKAPGVDFEKVTTLLRTADGFAVNLKTGERFLVEDAASMTVSGSTRLPLSDRETAWDSGAAKKTLAEGQYADAHFWRDPDGDPATLAAYKLPFAEVTGGSLTAVWRGVTAAAAAIQGSRGGVNIPEGDVAGVKARIAAYYRKAAAQYDDPSIVPPWDEAAAETETADPADLALDRITAFAEEQPRDEVDYEQVDGELRIVGFTPSEQAVEDALGALTVDTPHAAEIVRHRLEELVGRRFAAPAVEIRPPLDGGPGQGISLEWNGTLAPEGRLTDDGRAFAPGAIEWRDLPLSLAAMLKTADGHDGAEVCGKIDRVWRDDYAGLIRAEGTFMDSEFGWKIAEMVANGDLRGNSVDIAIHDVVYAPVSWFFTEDGTWGPTDEGNEALATGAADFDPFDESGERMVYMITKAVIGMSTVCPFPAFADARIESGLSRVAAGSPFVWTVTQDAAWQVRSTKDPSPWLGNIVTSAWTLTPPGPAFEPPPKADSDLERAILLASVTANDLSAADTATIGAELLNAEIAAAGDLPVCPPAEWFDDPNLQEATPFTVTDLGRIYGHAAPWGACHTGFPDVCVTAPRSNTDYRLYHLKTVRCDDGSDVACGTITLRAPHANQSLGRVGATAHYDHTGMAVADVRVGEDDHGIWVAGALRPGVDEETLRELRGAVLSGDWRNYEGNLELIALLAVNVPGFPVPRTRAVVAGGQMQTLTAAGWAAFETRPVDDVLAEIDAEEAPLTEFQQQILRALAARSLSDLAAR